jgi:hypothetical protein
VTSTEDLIAAYRAKGGQVTRCATHVPRALRGLVEVQRTQADIECEPADDALLERLRANLEHARAQQSDAPDQDEDWWAAYQIGACDPWRDIAEAAALLVIVRDVGLESYRLFGKELCVTRN